MAVLHAVRTRRLLLLLLRLLLRELRLKWLPLLLRMDLTSIVQQILGDDTSAEVVASP